MKKKVFKKEKISLINFEFWRYLINCWTVLFFSLIIYDFIFGLPAGSSLEIASTIYIGVLAVYVGNKEFERWYNCHHGRHPGEVFVIIWTILVFSLVVVGTISQGNYQIPSPIISSYIAVLTMLVITRKSKQIFYSKNRKKI